ncbi:MULTISPECIES: hypothetical protein [Clostridium]|uniref:hypothetical protein n=1 Tax=Clostridium TaxID=1485 RepID=UPI00069D343F|nr:MULTISPECIES: hypothetical protein [Clostridium]KOF57694.1 hypothetical protein AGR56_15605 [Clostridium sp. DMHC 10]MCD2348455.1 hypothetical protein [Clostridium guangxiense]
MKEIAGLLGWIGIWGYILALLNFFVKYINKKFINKLPKDKQKLISGYRIIMKYIVKYHKVIGIVASLAIIVHLYLMYTRIGLSIPGLIAALIMWTIFALGIYGVAINKNFRGKWVKVHRVLAFILIFVMLFHVMFTRVLLIRK